MEKLKSLKCTHCDISSIGSGIFEAELFPKLQFLDLSYNEIKTIENVEERPLDTLILSNNKIRECYLYYSTNIKNIFVDDNLIESLNGFQAMGGLECLSARNNHITLLKKEQKCFVLLRNLSELDLSKNDVCNKDNFRVELLSYLPNLSKDLEFILNEEDVTLKEIGEAMKLKLSRPDEFENEVNDILKDINEKRESNVKTKVELVDSWKRDTYLFGLFPKLREENKFTSVVSDLVTSAMIGNKQAIKSIIQLRKMCDIKLGFDERRIDTLSDSYERFNIRLGGLTDNIRLDIAIDTAVQSFFDDRKSTKNFSLNFINFISTGYKGRILRVVLPLDGDEIKPIMHKILNILNNNTELPLEPNHRKDGRTVFMKLLLKHITVINSYIENETTKTSKQRELNVLAKKDAPRRIGQTSVHEEEDNLFEFKPRNRKHNSNAADLFNLALDISEEPTSEDHTTSEDNQTNENPESSSMLDKLDVDTPKSSIRRPGKGPRKQTSKLGHVEETNDVSIEENKEFKPIDVKVSGDINSKELTADIAPPTVSRRGIQKKKKRAPASRKCLNVGTTELKEDLVTHLDVPDSGTTTNNTDSGTSTEANEEETIIKPKKVFGGQGFGGNAAMMAEMMKKNKMKQPSSD
ncbi:Leucine-rich repeat containing protein [Entamoeba marina]